MSGRRAAWATLTTRIVIEWTPRAIPRASVRSGFGHGVTGRRKTGISRRISHASPFARTKHHAPWGLPAPGQARSSHPWRKHDNCASRRSAFFHRGVGAPAPETPPEAGAIPPDEGGGIRPHAQSCLASLFGACRTGYEQGHRPGVTTESPELRQLLRSRERGIGYVSDLGIAVRERRIGFPSAFVCDRRAASYRLRRRSMSECSRHLPPTERKVA